MDLCPGGDLMALLANDIRLPEPVAIRYACWYLTCTDHYPRMCSDLTRALLALHSSGLVMRDLRPSQVLVDDGCLKLGTLESCLNLLQLSQPRTDVYNDDDEDDLSPRTSVLYMAPELLAANEDEGTPLCSELQSYWLQQGLYRLRLHQTCGHWAVFCTRCWLDSHRLSPMIRRWPFG